MYVVIYIYLAFIEIFLKCYTMGYFFLQAQNQKDQFYQRLEEWINWNKHCFTDCSEN